METGIPIALLFTVIGSLIIALVIMLIAKINSAEKRIAYLDECEKKNYSFRHNFDVVTKGIMEHLEREIGHIRTLMETKFEVIIEALKKNKNE